MGLLIELAGLFILGLAIGVWAGSTFNVKPNRDVLEFQERDRLRQTFETLAREKLEVLKSAITMGYTSDDMAQLDKRLEDIIGRDALRQMLDGTTPGDADIDELRHADEENIISEVQNSKIKHDN